MDERTLEKLRKEAEAQGKGSFAFAYFMDKQKDEPFAWEAREFLRKLVVGKTVLGSVVHTANNRDYGTLCLGEDPTTGIDVALRLVEEGLATVRDNCYDEGLKSAMEVAKAAGKGLHAEGASSHVRDITWDLGEGGGLKLVEQHKGKPIKAVVEHVRDGTTLRLFLAQKANPILLSVSLLPSRLITTLSPGCSSAMWRWCWSRTATTP